MSPPMSCADEKSDAQGEALLSAISARIGFTPNIAGILAEHPDVLALLAPIMCLQDHALSPMVQGSLGVAIAQEHASDYCLSMHVYLATHAAKLSADEIALNRDGQSDDARTDPLVRFAVRTVQTNGHVTDDDLALLRSAGLSETETLLLLLTMFRDVASSYLANILSPMLDFPAYPLANVANN
jgi:alkylhydroperoxidase family enzyme